MTELKNVSHPTSLVTMQFTMILYSWPELHLRYLTLHEGTYAANARVDVILEN